MKLLLLLVKIGLPRLGLAHVCATECAKLRPRGLDGAGREAGGLGSKYASSAGVGCAGRNGEAVSDHVRRNEARQNLRRDRRLAHHGAGSADVVGRRSNVGCAAVSLVAAHGVVRRVAVVNSQVAVFFADGLRVILRNFLRNEANLRAGVALVIVAVNILTVVGLADLLDVLLEALV